MYLNFRTLVSINSAKAHITGSEFLNGIANKIHQFNPNVPLFDNFMHEITMAAAQIKVDNELLSNEQSLAQAMRNRITTDDPEDWHKNLFRYTTSQFYDVSHLWDSEEEEWVASTGLVINSAKMKLVANEDFGFPDSSTKKMIAYISEYNTLTEDTIDWPVVATFSYQPTENFFLVELQDGFEFKENCTYRYTFFSETVTGNNEIIELTSVLPNVLSLNNPKYNYTEDFFNRFSQYQLEHYYFPKFSAFSLSTDEQEAVDNHWNFIVRMKKNLDDIHALMGTVSNFIKANVNP
jgi:hypothetical protein